MGSYCDFCGRRCFVQRFVPGSTATILATCAEGMKHDRATTGYDHTTAVNTSDPAVLAYVDAITDSAHRSEAYRIEQAILRVANNRDAQRPLKDDAATATDFASDFEWAAMIAREEYRR